MKPRNYPISALVIVVVGFVIVIGLAGTIWGQENPHPRVPVTEDWSTHHLVFSNPGTFEQATQNRPFLEWYRALSDPRYRFDQLRRMAAKRRGESGENVEPAADSEERLDADWIAHPLPGRPLPGRPAPKKKPQGDWNNFLGGTANAGITAATYPAKYTFDVNAGANCTNDFVVLTVNQAPANQTNASGTIVMNAEPAEGDTLALGSTIYVWHAATTNCFMN